MDNEESIISEVLSGKKEQFAMLIKEYQNGAYHLAYKLTGNKEEARDITQEAFIKAYLYLKSYNPSFKFQSWLYKIVVNIARNFNIRQKKIAALSDNAPAAQPCTEEINLPQNNIYQLIQKLPKAYKEIIILRCVQDFSYNEISEMLNIPTAVVKIRLFRARNHLKEILKQQDREQP